MGCTSCAEELAKLKLLTEELQEKLDEAIAGWTDERDDYKGLEQSLRAQLRTQERVRDQERAGRLASPAPTDMSGAGTPAQMMMAEVPPTDSALASGTARSWRGKTTVEPGFRKQVRRG